MATITTANTAATTAFNKTFYDRKMLERAQTKFVHQQFGQKRSIPKNSGKTVEFRRYNLFNVDSASLELAEGVTPNSQSIEQTTVTATIKQYGAYVEISDLLDLTAIDPVIKDSAELLGEQLGTCIDWVTRDAMLAGASAQYAGGNDDMVSVEATDVLSLTEIRKAVRTLEKSKARRFSDGNFVCILTPDQAYDLQSDTLWKEIAVHADPNRAYTGEIGRCFGTVFVKSTEGYVSKQSVLNSVNANTSSSTDFVLKNTPNAEAVAYLSKGGNKIKVGDTEYTLASSDSYTAASKTVKLSAAASLTKDAIVYTEDAGKPDTTTKKAGDVHHALMFGADAFGVIDIAGSGALRTIIKAVGSSGTADPLDQRSTVGAKVLAYVAKVLNSLWIIDIQTGVTA